MAAPPLVYSFIGAVFTAILYGKYWYFPGLDDKLEVNTLS